LAKVQRRKSYGIYFSIMVSFSVVVAGALYFAYGVLPRQYYLPIGLGVVVVAGALVYFILSRVVDI
jgi:hypothetical protein